MKLLYLAKAQSLLQVVLSSADVAYLLCQVNDVLILTFTVYWTVHSSLDVFFLDRFETDICFD